MSKAHFSLDYDIEQDRHRKFLLEKYVYRDRETVEQEEKWLKEITALTKVIF